MQLLQNFTNLSINLSSYAPPDTGVGSMNAYVYGMDIVILLLLIIAGLLLVIASCCALYMVAKIFNWFTGD